MDRQGMLTAHAPEKKRILKGTWAFVVLFILATKFFNLLIIKLDIYEAVGYNDDLRQDFVIMMKNSPVDAIELGLMLIVFAGFAIRGKTGFILSCMYSYFMIFYTLYISEDWTIGWHKMSITPVLSFHMILLILLGHKNSIALFFKEPSLKKQLLYKGIAMAVGLGALVLAYLIFSQS